MMLEYESMTRLHADIIYFFHLKYSNCLRELAEGTLSKIKDLTGYPGRTARDDTLIADSFSVLRVRPTTSKSETKLGLLLLNLVWLEAAFLSMKNCMYALKTAHHTEQNQLLVDFTMSKYA